MSLLRCLLTRENHSYEIEIGEGILLKQKESLSSWANRFAIVTDDQVAPLYGHILLSSLRAQGMDAELFSFLHGERSKTRATKESLENQLFDKGMGVDTLLIALGGGVVMDIAGYIAATYCRGIPLVMMPTTLLAMVDASIGGKNGLNLPYGKNMIGTIYQPKKVVIDLETLGSLSNKEKAQGKVEIIKHALIADRTFFFYLKEESHGFKKAIFESCRIKKEIVEEDERGRGRRHLLNFGHTLGHAIEQASHYSLSHGEAVSLGILGESYLSLRLGLLALKEFQQIEEIFQATLPLHLPSPLSIQEIMNLMILDKKSFQGKPRFVLLEEIGRARSSLSTVDEALVGESLEWLNRSFAR